MTMQRVDAAEWGKLTPLEKRERRFASWLEAPGIQFASPQAKAAYRARVQRIVDALCLRKPEMVPTTPFLADFAATYAGYTQKDILYDADKAIDAATRCTLEFDFDAKTAAATPQGRVWELQENKQRIWPGHGLPDDISQQFIEGEYMKEDEYDAFILDETDFRWRYYLPRTWGAAEALTKLNLAQANVGQFALPDVQESLKKLMLAGEEARKWESKISAANRRLTELGYPDFRSPMPGTAPFDLIGDNLRGQRGIVLDMYRQPEKLLEALDIITRKRILQIKQGARNIVPGASPIVGFPLHKGADGFMSDKQFRTFYWPSLRAIALALIEEGYVPELRTQGGYESRLDAIQDLPKGTILWQFYLTNIEKGFSAIGGQQCIMGSVPQPLLHYGSIQEVEDFSKKMIDTAGRDGGFMISSPGALGKDARAENVRAMIRAAHEYGRYR